MLLHQVDQRISLSKAVADVLRVPRYPNRIIHPLHKLFAQRLYGLCCGYEDLNDHERLRHDPLLQATVGTTEVLASSPTFSRLENRASRSDMLELDRVLVEQFIAAHMQAPAELMLDINAADVPLHGNQDLSELHGYHDNYCCLPLYVFCGQAMLCCVLRRSRIVSTKQAAKMFKLMLRRLRLAWPETHLIVRGDSGFYRKLLIRWCERHQISYVIWVARNAWLQKIVAYWEALLKVAYTQTHNQQRIILEFRYAAESW